MSRKLWFAKLFNLFLALALALGSLTALAPVQPVAAAGELTVDIIAGYNLVVDSNVSSPSTYAPRVATVIGKFCNTGADPLTDVYGYIGNGTTAGTYPVRNSLNDAEFQSGQKWNYLHNTGNYFFRHVGAASDASRYIGTIPAGECRYQYWTLQYPACENVSGNWAEPPCTGDPLWGTSVKPHDDLSLQFDIWGRGYDASANATRTDSERWTMTMRNEISAMANKIEPNGNPAGHWFNTDEDTVRVGDVITTNGVLYSLGNIRFGFDNDLDYVPDYNAWLQPISQPDYDPTCFRLIRTSGVLTVTRGGGNPPLIMPFTNNLYFTNLPPNNTNVRGEVYYTFLALSGPCNVNLSPYQEVASGFDNEKFNGDYGAAIPPVISLAPDVTINKTSTPNAIAAGSTTTYRIPFANTGNADAGLTLSSGYGINMPLTLNDTVPDGMQLASVATAFLNYSNNGVTIRYSTDSGATWSATAPVGSTSVWPNNKIMILWQLNAPLPKNSTGNYAEFQARVPAAGYSGAPFIENIACVGLGDAAPFGCATAITMVKGTGVIGDFVWRDENNDGAQTGETGNGINGVTISLYYDKNGDGKLDSGDLLFGTQDTRTSGSAGYYQFTELPAAKFLVAVNKSDSDIPTGYRANTPTLVAVTLAASGSNQTADFGFGPSLTIEKRILGELYEGREIVYGISLTNKRPGTGTTVGSTCVYEAWAPTGSTANAPKNFTDYFYAFGEPDGNYAYGNFSIGANRWIKGTGFDPGRASGTISKVEALFPLYLSTGWVNDQITTRMYTGTTEVSIRVFTQTLLGTYVGSNNAGYLVWDVTSSGPGGSWEWTDFPRLTLHLEPAPKSGASDPSQVNLDAIGFRVTVSGACPAVDVNDIMTTVPLTDTYDTTRLQFLSAEPPHTTLNTSTGVITWTNVGPIHPGDTRTVYVRFLAKDIINGTTSVTVNNSTGSTGTKFADGGSANNVYATATGTMIPTGSINGTVFSDLGTVGWPYVPATDLPIPGVKVTIYGCYDKDTGALVVGAGTNKTCADTNGEWRERATMLTDANGRYAFNGLLNGYFYVKVSTTNLPGTVVQTAEASDTQAVSGVLPNTASLGQTCGTCDSTWSTSTVRLDNNFNPINSPGETINGVNFGYRINPGVYGSVWEDNNGNGSKNSGEDPIGSVTVQLRTGSCSGTVISTTMTTTDGRYQLGNLTNGTTYYLTVLTSSLPGGASAWSQTGESDSTINNCISFPATTGALSGSHDFGFRNVGSYTIGDTLYYDWNGNGTQQVNEEGIPNITVSLYEDSNGNGVVDIGVDALIATTSTNSNGIYQFTNLPADKYLVFVDTTDPDFPKGVFQTQDPDESGICIACDSRGKVTITTSSINTIDFGYKPNGKGAIGDTVYRDMNGDGLQGGPTETGIADITVWLEVDLNNDGTYARVATAVTDANGKYLFSNLPDAKYRVVVDTADTELPKDAFGYAYIPSTPATTAQIIISGGNTYLDADFGFKPLGAIGNRVWQDNNGNGNQDEGEPGINGVTVGLYTWTDVDGDGVYNVITDTLSVTPLATQVTGANGLYLFTGLQAGNYVAKVDSGIPAGFTQTGDPDWLEPCTGALCDGASGVNLRTGQIDLSRDFGYMPPGVIGDYIWFDANADGVQDPGEGGIGFVTVYLCASASPCDSGNKIAQTVTDSDGYYSFGNLNDGTYYVKVDAATLPASVTITYDLDNNTTSPDGITAVTLSGGGSNLTADFGYRYYGAYSISGTTFFDAGNNGGAYDSGADAPYANITVYLWRDGAIIGTTITATDGSYTFPTLPNGNYVVSVNRNSPQLTGMAQNTPQPTPYYRPVTIADADKTQEDFGFFAAIDYDDLPDLNYNTTVAKSGAGHILGTLKLGTAITAESNGQPNLEATGDTGDDGIIFASGTWNPNTTVGLTANVSGANGYLVGWFDWNNDGKFGDGEMVTFGNMVNGSNSLSLNIPSGANTSGGYVYMRFRLYDKTTLTAISPTGLATNGEVEGYRHQWTPTSVDLVRFEAAAQGEAVLVAWETATELDNLGFNLYRGATSTGPWTLVNAVLIPAQNPGAVFGAVYEWLDTDVTPGAPVYYRLEDVDIHGASTFHGPISVTPSGPSAATVTGLAARGAPGLSILLLLTAACGLAIKRRR